MEKKSEKRPIRLFSKAVYATTPEKAASASVDYENFQTYAAVAKYHTVPYFDIMRDLKRMGYLSDTPGKVQDIGDWRIVLVEASYLTNRGRNQWRHFFSHRHYAQDKEFTGAWFADHDKCVNCDEQIPRSVLWHFHMMMMDLKLGEEN